MTHTPTIIVGAGLAGLIAAHAWPQARIVDRAPEPTTSHRALLRFRTDAVAKLTGVEFRRVTVRKGIWHDGAYRQPTPQLANWYALKCVGRLVSDRSIWNLDPVERYIAPDDFHEQLLAAVNRRVHWGALWRMAQEPGDPVVSTAPLSETIGLLEDAPDLAFHRAAITVQRFTLLEGTDLHQTVYFPSMANDLYRASITGRTLILEYASDTPHVTQLDDGRVLALKAFGLSGLASSILPTGSPVHQRFGKIAPIADDAARKHLLFRLTHEHNVYSLGRFATWRNILLDDVVDDIAVIKRLMRARGGAYDLRRSAT